MIADVAEYDIDKIKKAYDVMCNAGDIDNVVDFLISAIKNGYSEKVEKKASTSAKRNKIKNCEEREYTSEQMDDIEKRWLEKSEKR